MMSLKQIDDTLTGIWAIFLRKENALKYFTINSTSFAWSFAIIVIVWAFQAYMAPMELRMEHDLSSDDARAQINHTYLIILLSINWFLWPLIAYFVCKLMQLSENYVRYVTIDNYTSLVSLTLISAPSIMFQIGLPVDVAKSFLFFSTFIMLIYKWRVIKVSLATSSMYSSLMLFIDFSTTVIVSYVIRMLFVA